MKTAQSFSLIVGIFSLVLGVIGLIPGLVNFVDVTSKVSDVYGVSYGYIFGFIPTNGNLDFIHITAGVLGIAASFSSSSAYAYSRALAVFYGLSAAFGLIPYARTFFGTVPLYGSNIYISGISALIAFYFGFLVSPGLLELSTKNSK